MQPRETSVFGQHRLIRRSRTRARLQNLTPEIPIYLESANPKKAHEFQVRQSHSLLENDSHYKPNRSLVNPTRNARSHSTSRTSSSTSIIARTHLLNLHHRRSMSPALRAHPSSWEAATPPHLMTANLSRWVFSWMETRGNGTPAPESRNLQLLSLEGSDS